MSAAAGSRSLAWHDIGPLENELAPYGQRSPQRRDRVQAGNHALDSRGIFHPRHGGRARGIRTLTVLASPREVAQPSESLRLRHVGRVARILSPQSALASLLLALLARALPRPDVTLCGRDKRAPASRGASVDSIGEGEFSLDDVVHEVVRDVVIVGGRWIQHTRRLACNGDDYRVAPYAGAPESDVHLDHFEARPCIVPVKRDTPRTGRPQDRVPSRPPPAEESQQGSATRK
jgi:hypothetical protein